MKQTSAARGRSRGGPFLGVALLLVALGLLGLGVHRILEDRALTASKLRAEVLDVFVDEGLGARNRQDICHHEVRYVTGPDGMADVTSGVRCRASIGDLVTVHYDPANPANAAFEGSGYRWGDLAGILVIAAFLAVPGWILLRG